MVTAAVGVWPASVEAQLQRGAIHGVARDASGAVLPGAVIVLTSELSAPQETLSGVLGEFRFVNLDPAATICEPHWTASRSTSASRSSSASAPPSNCHWP